MQVSHAYDDFSRRVYCILGIPIDAITMDDLCLQIYEASITRQRLFISTPNLNFVMLSQLDRVFRRSLLESDVCPADGIGVILICKLLGIPIASRVAGSDIPAALQAASPRHLVRPLTVAFMGGDPGVGQRACEAVNRSPSNRLKCVAAIDPGMMTPEKMGNPALVAEVNVTGADFLIAALGAQKGQTWLLRHLQALTVPIVSHLGATLNFLAGTVKRAPPLAQRMGLEWLWRIKEEPHLLSRYVSDGCALLGLLLTRILPLACWLRWNRGGHESPGCSAQVVAEGAGGSKIIISGAASDTQLAEVADAFRSAAEHRGSIVLDVSGLYFFAMGFAGLILMLEKNIQRQNQVLAIEGGSTGLMCALKCCGLGHLIVST
jgi:N-acetylglucosaminyldiphosphoundecaprenol N-acetyl-beta-D-mannosaminyltransferase